MKWTFELVAGPFKGRTGGLAWDGKAMLFSAVMEERILRLDPASGKTSDFRKWTGRVNGIAIAADGSVFGAQEGGRRVVHFRNDGTTAKTQDRLNGFHHNHPNDLVIGLNGHIWFADAHNAQPAYGPLVSPYYPLSTVLHGELHSSVLRLDNYGVDLWRLSRATHDTLGPRALLLSADEKTLYVADGDVERGDLTQLFAYPVHDDGELGHGEAMLTFKNMERGIEGMCLDSQGNIIACMGWKKSGTPPAIIVVSPSGTILESHPAPADAPMRVAFGGEGLKHLYLTAADGGLYLATDIGRQGLERDRKSSARSR